MKKSKNRVRLEQKVELSQLKLRRTEEFQKPIKSRMKRTTRMYMVVDTTDFRELRDKSLIKELTRRINELTLTLSN